MRMVTHQSLECLGRTLHDVLGDATARRCDVPHSQLPSCECAKGTEGGAKDDDELAGSSSQLARVCSMDAVARRADRIHVTLAKDLRQALSYLTRLTYYSCTANAHVDVHSSCSFSTFKFFARHVPCTIQWPHYKVSDPYCPVAPAFQPRINTLPLEILAAIFILALPSDEQILKWDHRVPIWEKPIKLCAVW